MSNQSKQARSKSFKPLYVVMFDASDGPRASKDTGNPWHRLKWARSAISGKTDLYYIVKYLPKKRIGR